MPNLALCRTCGSLTRGFDNPGCGDEDCTDPDVEVFLNSHGPFGKVAELSGDILDTVVEARERDGQVIDEFTDTFLQVVGGEWNVNGDEFMKPRLKGEDGIEEFIEASRDVLIAEEGFTDEEIDGVLEEAREHVELWGEERLRKLYGDIMLRTRLGPLLDHGY